MKKLIAASAIAVGLLVPVGGIAAANAAPEPAASIGVSTDSIQIRAVAETARGKVLDIHGKAGPNHVNERVELIRDGQRVQEQRAPKIGTNGIIFVAVDAGTQGSHTYEVRLYNNQGTITAISNPVTVYTR